MKKLYTIFAALFLAATTINVSAQEMILGGDMEEDDAAYWTIVDLAAGNGHTETFGYTDDWPSDGDGGCLSLAGDGAWSNVAVCQEIEIQKGVDYKISMQVKTSLDLELDKDWVEVVLVAEMPVVDGDITSFPNVFALNSWECPDMLSVDGDFADWNCGAKSPLNDEIYFEGTGDTTVVLVLKAGGDNTYNILFDNVSVMGPDVAVEAAAINAANIVYPNPATDQIRISNVDANEIQIFDIVGKKVYSTLDVSEEMTIDISGFKDGMYFVRTGRSTTKILKQLSVER